MTTESRSNNHFLEKTIENWLTTTSELGYQMPFCQLLLCEGYSICHNSKHNAFEQGKDIIAINPEGKPCCFQLKGGDISNAKWRNEVKAEIEELIDYQIVHPSTKKGVKHISYLVTNGQLDDTVRLAIDNLNNGKWKDNPLRVITYGELLKRFIKISNNFTPQEVSNYKSFLDLYFNNGKELIDEQKYTDFISEVLRLNENGLSRAERQRNIAAAILYTGYIITTTKNEQNHITVIQVLSLLSSYILCLIEKYSLDDKYWVNSFEVLWGEIEINSQNLQDEINDKGLEKMITSMWDGELGQFRSHLAISYLLSYKCAQLLDGNEKCNDILNDAFLVKLKDSLTLWGEAGLYPFILLTLLINKKTSISKDDAFKPVGMILDVITKLNGREGQAGIFSPYYNITTVIKNKFGLLDEPIDENFVGRSFYSKATIDLLARHDRRSDVEKYWRKITHISQEEFLPKENWMHFLWRCDKGESDSSFPKQTQSWKELQEAAIKINQEIIPETLKKQLRFLPFFLLLYPHRITSNYIKYLDEAISKK